MQMLLKFLTILMRDTLYEKRLLKPLGICRTWIIPSLLLFAVFSSSATSPCCCMGLTHTWSIFLGELERSLREIVLLTKPLLQQQLPQPTKFKWWLYPLHQNPAWVTLWQNPSLWSGYEELIYDLFWGRLKISNLPLKLQKWFATPESLV